LEDASLLIIVFVVILIIQHGYKQKHSAKDQAAFIVSKLDTKPPAR